jgi:hypothetical protein
MRLGSPHGGYSRRRSTSGLTPRRVLTQEEYLEIARYYETVKANLARAGQFYMTCKQCVPACIPT